jgi:hypothetical protein
MVIVDSSVWIDALQGTTNPHTAWLKNAIGSVELGLTSLTLCEVLQGVRMESQFRGFKSDLLQFPVFDALTTELAIAAAVNFRKLRQKGITVRKTIDCIIATFCIESGFQLLHRDHDFDAFANHLGLLIVDPPAIP